MGALVVLIQFLCRKLTNASSSLILEKRLEMRDLVIAVK